MIERGDTNSWYTSTVWGQMPRKRPGWVESGFIRAFMDMSFPGYTLDGNEEQPEFPCPVVDKLLETPEQQDIWASITGPRTFASKNLIGPPGMEPGVLGALRDALSTAMADEKFVSDMEAFTGIKSNFTPGAKAQEDLIKVTNQFFNNKPILDQVTQDMFDKFVN